MTTAAPEPVGGAVSPDAPDRSMRLLSHALGAFAPLAAERDALNAVLSEIAALGDPHAARAARRLALRLGQIAPAVTLIGQVKAGKTTLANAMIGAPGLLPADVNPWTSVVTSLHLAPGGGTAGPGAAFTFFDAAAWDRLIERGGRIGELAARAGAEDDLARVRDQVAEMRRRAADRLGRRFELLLGQTHDYGSYDADLIARYVCLGDDPEDTDAATQQGRFADITRSAEVRLDRPEMPIPLTLRDTPGVNDTFLMREQITLGAIRDSRICVVVLSAHQALSSVDMALVRLIANVRSREVLIFVNRIDELADPVAQVDEIRQAIDRTLRDHEGPKGVQILFGSAAWAETALSGGPVAEKMAATRGVARRADARGIDPDGPADETLWSVSGVPDLYAALAERIAEGIGREALDRIATSARNLVSGLRAGAGPATVPAEPTTPPDAARVEAELISIEGASGDALAAGLETALADLDVRLERAHRSFLDRATSHLLDHLETHGDGVLWQYDATSLRVLLRGAFRVFARDVGAQFDEVAGAAARDLEVLGTRIAPAGDRLTVAAPTRPRVAPPVSLGQTIALDLRGNWWSRWWHRRRGYRALAADFHAMIAGETGPMLDDLRRDHAHIAAADASETLAAFLAEQREILSTLAGPTDASSAPNRQASLDAALAALDAYAA